MRVPVGGGEVVDLTPERVDYPLEHLHGEVIPLDWDAHRGRILVLQVEEDSHRLGLLDAATSEVELVRAGAGSYAEPDVASPATYYSTSHLASDGSERVFE